MIRAFRPSTLGRQPWSTRAISTTSSNTSPFQRLVAQTWRNTTIPTPTTVRSIHSAKSAAKSTAARLATQSIPRNPPPPPKSLLSRIHKRNFNWSWSRRSQTGGAKGEESLSLSGRLRKLSREYGWSAVGVYFALSVLDFPFCFLLVKWAGTERIADIEHWVLSNVKKIIPEDVKEWWHDYRTAMKNPEGYELGDNQTSKDMDKAGWGVEEAQERHTADASLATQLALAYAIHKSFIFIRVPLTAAVTPKVVKVLRSWGWQIGKRKPKTNR